LFGAGPESSSAPEEGYSQIGAPNRPSGRSTASGQFETAGGGQQFARPVALPDAAVRTTPADARELLKLKVKLI